MIMITIIKSNPKKQERQNYTNTADDGTLQSDDNIHVHVVAY